MLSEQAIDDLERHALQRCEDAANAVAQLMDNDQQRFRLLICLSSAIADMAARLLCERSNRHPELAACSACYGNVLQCLAAGMGMKANYIDAADAERLGLRKR